MKRIDNLFLLLAAIVLLASSCGNDDGVMVQGTNRAHGVNLISTGSAADNSKSTALSTLLTIEWTKHVDLSA